MSAARWRITSSSTTVRGPRGRAHRLTPALALGVLASLAPPTVVATLGACGDGGGFPDAPLPDGPTPGGTLSVAWSLADPEGASVACSRVGAQTVTLILRNRGAVGALTEVFTCGSGMGTSLPVRPGIYDIQFELHGATGLIASAATQAGLEVRSAETTTLMPVVFTVDPQGGLDLALTANQAGGNCAATAAGGAGITGFTLALQRVPGGCVPVTFAISAGATQPAGSYTVNCNSPLAAPCIEADQRLTVSGIESGDYRLRIRGSVGAAECYVNDDLLSVPAQGATLTRTLNLAKLDAPGC